DHPTVVVDEPLGRRRVVGIAGGGAGRCPAHQRRDLVLVERALVEEDAVLRRRGVPRRHLTRFDLLGDGLGPGAGLVVARERSGGGWAAEAGARGAVALLAVLLEDWEHLAVEGGRRRRGIGGGGGGGARAHDRDGREGERG